MSGQNRRLGKVVGGEGAGEQERPRALCFLHICLLAGVAGALVPRGEKPCGYASFAPEMVKEKALSRTQARAAQLTSLSAELSKPKTYY